MFTSVLSLLPPSPPSLSLPRDLWRLVHWLFFGGFDVSTRRKCSLGSQHDRIVNKNIQKPFRALEKVLQRRKETRCDRMLSAVIWCAVFHQFLVQAMIFLNIFVWACPWWFETTAVVLVGLWAVSTKCSLYRQPNQSNWLHKIDHNIIIL